MPGVTNTSQCRVSGCASFSRVPAVFSALASVSGISYLLARSICLARAEGVLSRKGTFLIPFVTNSPSMLRHRSLRLCEHGVATRRVSGRDFFLHHVPVFDHFAIVDAEDIDRDHRPWPPAGITAMNHDEIA